MGILLDINIQQEGNNAIVKTSPQFDLVSGSHFGLSVNREEMWNDTVVLEIFDVAQLLVQDQKIFAI